ncbi:MAG: T9SS type A sorting domain-containing protein [Balneola sp.]
MFKATINKACSLLFTLLLIFAFSANSQAQNTLYGSNIIADGDFSGDTLSNKWVVEGTAGTASVINGELAFTNLVETANQYDFQVNQPFSEAQLAALAEGGTFELSFDARTTADSKTFHAFLGEVGGGWARFWTSPGDGDITVDNTTKTYTLTTEVVELTWAAMRLGFEVSTDTSSLFIDNVQLRKVTDNIIRNGDFSADSAWTFQAGAANIEIVNGELAFTNIPGTGNIFDIQAYQPFTQEQLDSIYVGPYEVTFEARTSTGTKDFHLFLGEVGGGWARYFDPAGEGTITVDTEMKKYTLSAAVAQTWPEMRVGFEVNTPGADLYIDNLTFTRITDVAPDAPEVALSTSSGIVTVTVTDNGAATYDVYYADSAFTDATGGALIATLTAEGGLTTTHTIAAPHPDLVQTFNAHYGVIARSQKGSASDMTSDMIETETSVSPYYAVELSSEAIGVVSEAANGGTVPDASALAAFFPANYVPFTLNSETTVAVNGAPDNDADNSSKHWIGFDAGASLLVIYSEVTDDSLVFNADGAGASGGAWNFDSWEMGFGNYSPESFIQGSDHTTLEGGAEPDWQFRGGGLKTESSVRGFFHAYGLIADRINGEIPNSVTSIETSATGYRTLSVLSMTELAGGVTSDAAIVFPTGTEYKTFPMNISINDNDGTARDAQIAWANNTQNGDWWQNPFQWDVVAFVGADAVFTVSNENEELGNVREFSLDQNYPNPFNPTTNITFSLANSSNVTLEVFNMLGQKVATLLQQEQLSVGQHTQTFDASSLASGMYVYRLSTGNFVQSRKMMLIK